MEIFPRRLSGGVSWLLPPLEVALGSAVAAGWWLPWSGWLVLALLAGFLAVLGIYRWRGGRELVCGCFADFERKTPTSRVIVRNVLLLAVGLPLLVPGQEPAAGRGVGQWVLAGTVVVGLFLVWGLATRLAEAVAMLRVAGRVDEGAA